jgi:hypothetical protein
LAIRATRTVSILAALLAAGCGPSGSHPDGGPPDSGSVTCQTDSRVTAYTAGMSAASPDRGLTATLVSSDPAPPANTNNTWLIKLTDSSGNPVDGATVGVVPTMPYMGHGTPIHPVVTAQSGGQYQVADINLFMPGIWEVTLGATTPSNATAENVSFFFCVEG